MAMPWTKDIKQTGKLSYFLAPSLKGLWPAAVKGAVKEFNALSTNHKLGVVFTETKEPLSERGGAEVQIAAGDGKVEYRYGGDQSIAIHGRGLQGRAQMLSIDGAVEKVFMLLPITPMINTPKGQRPTGLGVMTAIALHELIHACGLENKDHTEEDVFNGYPSVKPGPSPGQDKLQIRVNEKYKFMPPLLFSKVTANKIKKLWPQGHMVHE